MTTVIFNDWLIKWDLELKRKIVSLADNCTEHTNSSLLKNIKVIFLPANTTSLIQPCDLGITRAFKVHYRREIRAGIVAELDDIQDQSEAGAVAKKISLLDTLRLVAMLWKRVSEKTIEYCFRKGGFSKTNAETPASEESDLTREIFDQAPDGMKKEEFENWLDIDINAEVVDKMTTSEMCQAVADDKFKLAEESESNCTSKEEEILEVPPNNAEMREALRILRRGVQHRATNCQRHYENEQFIQELLNANKKQATIHKFFKNKFCFLYM